MKIFAFATLSVFTLAAPIESIATSVDTSFDLLANSKIEIEFTDASDEVNEDTLDYTDEEFEAIFAEVEMMVKCDQE